MQHSRCRPDAVVEYSCCPPCTQQVPPSRVFCQNARKWLQSPPPRISIDTSTCKTTTSASPNTKGWSYKIRCQFTRHQIFALRCYPQPRISIPQRPRSRVDRKPSAGSRLVASMPPSMAITYTVVGLTISDGSEKSTRTLQVICVCSHLLGGFLMSRAFDPRSRLWMVRLSFVDLRLSYDVYQFPERVINSM